MSRNTSSTIARSGRKRRQDGNWFATSSLPLPLCKSVFVWFYSPRGSSWRRWRLRGLPILHTSRAKRPRRLSATRPAI